MTDLPELDPKALDKAANVFSANRFSAKHLDTTAEIIQTYLAALAEQEEPVGTMFVLTSKGRVEAYPLVKK